MGKTISFPRVPSQPAPDVPLLTSGEPAPVVDIGRARLAPPKDDVLQAIAVLAALFDRPGHDVRKNILAIMQVERPTAGDPFFVHLPEICRAVFGEAAPTSTYYQLKGQYGWDVRWVWVDGNLCRRLSVIARVRQVYTDPAANVGEHVATVARGLFRFSGSWTKGAALVSRTGEPDSMWMWEKKAALWVCAYTYTIQG